MDALATRGHIILDDAKVRLRTSGAAQRFSDLFVLKADSSTVSTGLGERPTAIEVTAQISAAIDALTGSAPVLLNTLGEIANALNDDNEYECIDCNTPVFACLSTLPMGWSHALHLCHSAYNDKLVTFSLMGQNERNRIDSSHLAIEIILISLFRFDYAFKLFYLLVSDPCLTEIRIQFDALITEGI